MGDTPGEAGAGQREAGEAGEAGAGPEGVPAKEELDLAINSYKLKVNYIQIINIFPI